MSDGTPGRGTTSGVRGDRADRGAVRRWENEGGAIRGKDAPSSDRASGADADGMGQGSETAAHLDARQDEIMAMESSDGRPPTHKQRRLEWRWLAVLSGLIVGGFVTWIVVDRAGIGLIGAVLVYAAILMFAASPVWLSALLRGREERSARVEAEADREAGESHG